MSIQHLYQSLYLSDTIFAVIIYLIWTAINVKVKQFWEVFIKVKWFNFDKGKVMKLYLTTF